ncbi:zinc finger protein 197-like [Armigeres subalbatus]|uniref:zinc finger protein 197-like n=1 Tax=Armigeres subalbatus TaxID=124917 RepID=UPI002ED68AE4
MVSKAKMQKISGRSNQMCRLCLSKECLEDIFKVEDLHLWISDFLSIKITTEDRVSLAICSKCRLRLTEFNEFRTRCQEVQDVLKLMAEKKDKAAIEKPVKLSVKAGTPDKTRDGSRKNATIRCQTCNKKFENRTFLREHKWRAHAQTPHVCPTCGKGFARRDRLQIHKETHTQNDQTTKIDQPKANQLQCQECLKIFKTQKQLYDHKRVHGPRIYECSFCEKSFAVRQQWQKHLPTHANQTRKDQEKIRIEGSPQNADDEPCVQTEDEEHTAADKQMIIEHESITIEEVKIEFGSDTDTEVSYGVDNTDVEQGPSFLNAARPDQPIKGTEKVEYCLATLKCYPCSKTFKNKRKFWDHNRLIHGPKNYLCTICEKAFALPGDRNRHVRMHKKDKRTHRSKVAQQSSDSTNPKHFSSDVSKGKLITVQPEDGEDKSTIIPENGIDIKEKVKIELCAEDDDDDDEDYDSDEEISIIVPRHMITNAFEDNKKISDQKGVLEFDGLKGTNTVEESVLANPQTSEADHQRIVHGPKKYAVMDLQ